MSIISYGRAARNTSGFVNAKTDVIPVTDAGRVSGYNQIRKSGTSTKGAPMRTGEMKTVNRALILGSVVTVSLMLGCMAAGCSSSNPLSYSDDTGGQAGDEALPKMAAAAAAPATIKLTVTTDGHGVTYPSGTTTTVPNANYWISSAPKMGWEFSRWVLVSGTGTFMNAAEGITRVQLGTVAATVKATYRAINPKVYTLTITNDGHGKTGPGGGINLDQTWYIWANPNKGYVFSNWSVTKGTATIRMQTNGMWTAKLVNGSATIKANFKAAGN